jgi:energy-coupling factor transporter ATP-binding protein EcfA2
VSDSRQNTFPLLDLPEKVWDEPKEIEVPLDTALFFVGPGGSGKSLLAKRMAKINKFTFVDDSSRSSFKAQYAPGVPLSWAPVKQHPFFPSISVSSSETSPTPDYPNVKYIHYSLSKLSGGERSTFMLYNEVKFLFSKKLTMLQMKMASPRGIIIDEPELHLNPKDVADHWTKLLEHKPPGCIPIFVTHALDLPNQLKDKAKLNYLLFAVSKYCQWEQVEYIPASLAYDIVGRRTSNLLFVEGEDSKSGRVGDIDIYR